MDNWGIEGHEWAVRLLASDLAAGRLRHAYLFAGSPAIGKRTLALKFAQAVNCLAPGSGNPPGPCGECRPCRLIGKAAHPDVPLVFAGADGSDSRSIKIEQVRELEAQVALTPYEARYRAPVLLRFHEATPAAQNALLKTLEEPPAQVVLLLTADAPDLLLPTIVSRCQVLPLRPPAVAQVQRALLARGLPPQRAELLAHLSGGRIGWAFSAAEAAEALAQRAAQLDEMQALLAAPARERRAFAEVLGKRGRAAVLDTLELWQTWWRDVMLTTGRAVAPLANVDRAAVIQQAAAAMDAGQAHAALRALRATMQAVERNGNVRLALEVLMLDLPFINSSSPVLHSVIPKHGG